jgi:hypothetical protein
MRRCDDHLTDRVNASFRLPEPLYVRLMAAAERNLRTMSNEAAFRLQQTFEREEQADTPKA